ncbi:MAG: flagellar basal-body MS-ring/collar protein FliF [Bryobacteraceae bacterium]
MEQLKRLLASLSTRQKVTVALAAALVAAGVYGFSYWRREAGFRPLYTGLAAEDAGAVVQKLKQANVPYRLSENGGTVLAPADRLSELRLQLAMEGLPKTGRLGFELFDKTSFGVTDFAEHINYRRALEGELERSVGHLAEVEQARIHITFPKDSVFLEARQPAKASVMLRLRAGAQLSPQNVQAVCHLVAAAVEGLAPEAVSVVDTRGTLLNRPRRDPGDPLVASEANLEYRQKIERDLLRKIQATLEPLLGAGRFEAGVSVECDFTAGEQSEENYDPARAAILTSQKSEDNAPGLAAAGVPGTPSNLPRPTPAATVSTTLASRRTENFTYQPSRVVRHTRQAQGALKRLSVALLIDQDVRWEGPAASPRRVLVPPTPEKLKSIRDLVAGIVSFDQARGDQLVVETLPFEATLKQAPPSPPAAPPAPGGKWQLPGDRRLWMLGGGAALILFLLFAAAVWMTLGRRRTRPKQPAPEAPAELPPPQPEGTLEERMQAQLAEQDAERARLEAATLESIRVPVKSQKTEVIGRHLKEQITKDPTPCAQVLRGWLSE